MKLIKIKEDCILKERRKIVERDTDIMFIDFQVAPKVGEVFVNQSLPEQFRSSIQISKDAFPDTWKVMKDASQETLIMMVKKSIDRDFSTFLSASLPQTEDDSEEYRNQIEEYRNLIHAEAARPDNEVAAAGEVPIAVMVDVYGSLSIVGIAPEDIGICDV